MGQVLLGCLSFSTGWLICGEIVELLGSCEHALFKL
jgi:hypothetical protein